RRGLAEHSGGKQKGGVAQALSRPGHCRGRPGESIGSLPELSQPASSQQQPGEAGGIGPSAFPFPRKAKNNMQENQLLDVLTREGVLINVSVRYWRATKKLNAE